jgi:hypothetical protein
VGTIEFHGTKFRSRIHHEGRSLRYTSKSVLYLLRSVPCLLSNRAKSQTLVAGTALHYHFLCGSVLPGLFSAHFGRLIRIFPLEICLKTTIEHRF